MYQVTEDVLDAGALIPSLLRIQNAGSVLIHCAVVREISGQAVTTSVSYAALSGAIAELEAIGQEIQVKWHLGEIRLIRRIGRLQPGEIIAMVGVVAARSDDAFRACEEAVARLKQMKRIRKEEVFRG